MIDLSTCVSGQKVRFANGKIGEVLLGIGWSGHPNMLRVTYNNERWWCCTLDGIPNSNICSAGWEIVEILPLEIPEEEPVPTPQEMDYKKAYIEIANIISVAFPECEVAATDMARLLIHENRTLRMALGLPSYKQVSDAIDDEEVE